MKEPQAAAGRSDSDHYREMARKLLELARQFLCYLSLLCVMNAERITSMDETGPPSKNKVRWALCFEV